MLKEFSLRTSERIQLVNITAQVERILQECRLGEGLCLVYVPHTTAGVTINEAADPSVVRDISRTLSKLIPEHGDYSHGEGNSDAHIKTVLTGSTVAIPVTGGKLALGTWQGIFFCEYDGPRTRRVLVKLLGSL